MRGFSAWFGGCYRDVGQVYSGAIEAAVGQEQYYATGRSGCAGQVFPAHR
jgi:hypothetical protein